MPLIFTLLDSLIKSDLGRSHLGMTLLMDWIRVFEIRK